MDRETKERVIRNIVLIESQPSATISREPERLMTEILEPPTFYAMLAILSSRFFNA